MENFYTCGQEKMLYLSYDRVIGCCSNRKTGAAPHLGSYGKNGEINIEEIISLKMNHLKKIRNNEIPWECVDCPSLQLNKWAENKYIFNDINLQHFTACNTNCYYCRTNSNTAPIAVNAKDAPKVLPLIKELVDRGLVDPKAIIRFGGGEPTLLPEFDEIIDYFLSIERRFFLNTSGVKFSSSAAKMMVKCDPFSKLVISIDSATRETYKVIKGMDLSDRVWENISKYAAVNSKVLEVKFIVLPENFHETSLFVEKCNSLGVKHISFDLDCNPALDGTVGSLTNDIIKGISNLIYAAFKFEITVYWSSGGSAVWDTEKGFSRLKKHYDNLNHGLGSIQFTDDGYVLPVRSVRDFKYKNKISFGRYDCILLNLKNDEYHSLIEDESTSEHRVEQVNVKVLPNIENVIDFTAKPFNRKKIMVEAHDHNFCYYARVKLNLISGDVIEIIGNSSIVTSVNEHGFCKVQYSIIPESELITFNITVLDDTSTTIYPGDGVHAIDISNILICSNSSNGSLLNNSKESIFSKLISSKVQIIKFFSK
jgi:organic radical activating enzyme